MQKAKEQVDKNAEREKNIVEGSVYIRELNSTSKVCPACHGDKSKNGKTCETCNGIGEVFKGIDYMRNYNSNAHKFIKISRLGRAFKTAYRAWTKKYK